MYLNKDEIKSLEINEIDELCRIAGIKKLKNIVVDYRKDSNTRGRPYGKGSKEWKNIDNDNPNKGFIEQFFEYKFLKEDSIDEQLLGQFENKLLKTLLGKTEYENASEEKITVALNGWEQDERNLLLRVFGYEVEEMQEEETEQMLDLEETVSKPVEKEKQEQLSTISSIQKKIDEAVAKTKKQDKKEYDSLKKKYDALLAKNEKLTEEKRKLSALNEDLIEKVNDLSAQNTLIALHNSNIKTRLAGILKMEEKDIKEEELCLEKDNVFELLSLIKDEILREHIEEAKEILVRAYITIGLLAKGQK